MAAKADMARHPQYSGCPINRPPGIIAAMNNETLYAQACALEADGKHGDAVVIYKQLSKCSVDPRVHIAYGVCLQRLGHWQESVKHLQHGIDLKPHYCEGDARLFLAESLLHTGQKSLAIQQWRLVSSMQPEYPSYGAVPDEAKKMLKKHAPKSLTNE